MVKLKENTFYQALRRVYHRYSRSRMTIQLNVGSRSVAKRFVTNSLPLKIAIQSIGQNERSITERFLEELKAGDTLWDVGANLGVISLMASDLIGPTGRGFAFEPDVRVLPYLRQNVETNGCSNVTICPYALGNEDCKLQLYDGCDPTEVDYSANLGSGKLTNTSGGSRPSIAVDVWRGKTAIEELGVPAPTCLKVDVEGAELGVLKGLGAALSNVRVVFLEAHPHLIPHFGASVQELLEYLESFDFDCVCIQERGDNDSGGQSHYLCCRR